MFVFAINIADVVVIFKDIPVTSHFIFDFKRFWVNLEIHQRSFACQIRLFPSLISKIRWLWSVLTSRYRFKIKKSIVWPWSYCNRILRHRFMKTDSASLSLRWSVPLISCLSLGSFLKIAFPSKLWLVLVRYFDPPRLTR